MIEDINNSREITIGDKNIAIESLYINSKPLAEIIYEKDESNGQKFNGKNSKELNAKNVVLRFDGEKGLEQIDMLIEDLLAIRQNLEFADRKNCTMCRHHYTGHDGKHNYCDLSENYTEIENIYETCLNYEQAE